MATLIEAIAERDRVMQAYPGVTLRFAALSGAFGLLIHDIRASAVKTSGQKAVIAANSVEVGDSGAATAWTTTPIEPAATQAIYT